MSTQGPVSKHWLGFSYIPSVDYELDLNFDVTETKIKSYHSSNDIVKLFFENIVVIEETKFSDISLADGSTVLIILFKCATSISNQK